MASSGGSGNIGGGGGGRGGATTGAGTRVGVTLKLSQLQNLCKRDPEGYREDYDAQVRRLESELTLLALHPESTTASASSSNAPNSKHKGLEELVQFAAAISSSSYKGEESDRIANLLMGVLAGGGVVASATAGDDDADETLSVTTSGSHLIAMPSATAALQLPRDVRKSVVSALILMRNKGAVPPLRLLELFFRILAVVPDKQLRELLHRHVVNDVRNINKKGKRDDKVNRAIQSFFHRVVGARGGGSSSSSMEGAGAVESATDVAAKRATDMVCELYRRRVWTDDRTVAILASAALSHNSTTMSRALRFFLNIEEKMLYDQQQREDDEVSGCNRVDYHSHSRKTAARQRHVQRQLKKRKKVITEKNRKDDPDWMDAENPEVDADRGVETSKKLYPAIELLRDPQGLAEAVLKRLKAGTSGGGSVVRYKYEVKLLMMNFVTRLVGNHQLLVLPLYSFLTKYLSGQQRDVTAVLAYTVQACHEYVPPDEVYALLKTIAHNFITERCSEEQMAVGINAARAICSRVPSVMSQDESSETTGTTTMDIEAFARDLAAFGNHRDRSVSMAGKSWQNFVREVNPSLLQGKDRGLKGTALHRAGVKPLRYGEKRTAMGVEGADLLVEYESKKKASVARRIAEEQQQQDPTNKSKKSAGNDEDDWEEVDVAEGEEGSDDESSVAPDLVLLEGGNADNGKKDDVAAAGSAADEGEGVVDVSKMTPAEREELKQRVSSTRIFTASDFGKMRRLVEREQRAKRDPREAARRKRAIARGEDFEELSGGEDGSDSDTDSDDEQVHISGAVNPTDIMANARKKRQSKAMKLEKVIAGRTEFEAKNREGGSTNVEKKRKKNFLMTKFSREARAKNEGKGSIKGSLKSKHRNQKSSGTHEARKRRRKL